MLADPEADKPLRSGKESRITLNPDTAAKIRENGADIFT